MRCGVGKPVLDIVPRWPEVVLYTLYLIILFIFHLLTLFFSLFVLIWMQGGHGTNEGGDNNGSKSRLGFWRSFQPRWTSTKSSDIHAFENVYTSNTLIDSFEYMDCMLASGTLKNLRFLMRSWRWTHILFNSHFNTYNKQKIGLSIWFWVKDWNDTSWCLFLMFHRIFLLIMSLL
jgi:hypothetical protein